MKFNISKAPPFVLEKISNLCGQLWQGKKDYEKISADIVDDELRQTVLTLAQESNQYACELSSQIEILGGVSQKETVSEDLPEVNTQIPQDASAILAFCRMQEKKMVSAYHHILNESYLYEGLRKMMRYQLNGILHSFMQIKLLNSLKLR